MSDIAKTELFASNDAHARYAVDLLYRLAKAMEAHVDCDLKAALGDELHHELCHAIGWDIDWDAVRNT